MVPIWVKETRVSMKNCFSQGVFFGELSFHLGTGKQGKIYSCTFLLPAKASFNQKCRKLNILLGSARLIMPHLEQDFSEAHT